MESPKSRLLPLILIATSISCSTSPPQHQVTPQEQQQLDRSASDRISEDFEHRVEIRKDIELNVYFRRIGEALLASKPETRGAPVGVQVIRDRDGRWRDYGLPGNRVYLSTGLLKSIEFENELAAAIALELSYIRRRSALTRLEERESAIRAAEAQGGVTSQSSSRQPLSPGALFGETGIFAFSVSERAAASDEAIQMLYSAGYDPRGLASLLERMHRAPSKSPLDEVSLERMLESTRIAIARYSPLRNPIVRTEEFLRIQGRIAKL